MALVSIHGFRTLPGKFVDHLAAMDEAKTMLQERGLQAALLQPIAGGEAGQIALAVAYDDNRAYAEAIRRIQEDSAWQAWYAEVASKPIAEPTEISIYNDVDPTWSPPDGTVEVLQVTQWRTIAGEAARFMEHVVQAKSHIERLGGGVRVMQCMTGALPMTVTVSVAFEDIEHFGDYSDKLAVDEQFQAYWTGVMTKPSATLVRSGLYAITV